MLGVAHRMDALTPSWDKFILRDGYGQGCLITLQLLHLGKKGIWKSGGWALHVRDRLASKTNSSIPKCSMLPINYAISINIEAFLRLRVPCQNQVFSITEVCFHSESPFTSVRSSSFGTTEPFAVFADAAGPPDLAVA